MKKIILAIASISVASCFAMDANIWIQNLIANELAKKWIITPQDHLGKYRTESTISRAELVGIALRVKGVKLPSNYICKGYFEDVTKNDWICRATELAADTGMISRQNKRFRPNDMVTYTEGLSIIYKASGLNPTWTEKPEFISRQKLLDWQKQVLYSIYNTSIALPETYPNYSADLLRWSAFGFVADIINSLDEKNNSGKITYSLRNRDEYGAQELTIKKGGEITTVESNSGYISSAIIIDNFIIYKWSSTGWSQVIVYDIQNKRHILASLWDSNISYDGKIIYDCAYANWYSLFSFERKKVLHRYRGATPAPGSGEMGPPPHMCNYSTKNYGTLIFKNGEEYILEKEWKNPLNILDTYYSYLSWFRYPDYVRIAYDMRIGNSESLATFKSWYNGERDLRINTKNIKNLGENVYEFTVEEVEYIFNEWKVDIKVISRYLVKSKVNIENFTIENISSVKI